MTKQKTKGNIRLKRVIAFNGSTSLAITLPRAFIRASDIKPNQYVSVELQDNDRSITVRGLGLG